MDDGNSTPTTDSGASNAADFQPLTQNPQNDVSNVQSTQGLQAPSGGLTQESLLGNRPLTVETETGNTTLVPQAGQPDIAEARAEIVTLIIVALILLALGLFWQRRKRGARPSVIEVPTSEAKTTPEALVTEPQTRLKKKPKATKTRPHKKAKAKR